jgi:HAD superfamily hydrolase (TIGR01509 family)
MLKDKKYIIFDFDGVIVASEHVWDKVERAFITENGGVIPDNYIAEKKKIVQRKPNDIWNEINKYIIELGNLDIEPEDMQKIKSDRVKTMYKEIVEVRPNLIEMLKRLNEDGYKMGIVSSQYIENIVYVLDRYDISHYFDKIISLNDVEYGKPSSEGFNNLLYNYEYDSSDYLVFEDSYVGVVAAKRIGLDVCAVEYDFQRMYVDEIKELSDFYIEDYKEVISMLEE